MTKRVRGPGAVAQIKREIIKAGMAASAVEIAKQKIYQKIELKKPLMLSLKEHFGKAIDRIDPIELAATISLTYVLKTIVDSSEELVASWSKTFEAAKARGVTQPLLHPSYQAYLYKIVPEIPKTEFSLESFDIFEWCACFALAAIIVKNPSIVTGGLTGLLKVFAK